jgi:IS30 family transposase
MAKEGPKFKEIKWKEFDKLCAIQCLKAEIASWFNVSEDTIERAVKREQGVSYAVYYAQKAEKGKINLRRQQWQLALQGDKTMLIWLGKQHLMQSDKKAYEHTGADGQPLLNSLTDILKTIEDK